MQQVNPFNDTNIHSLQQQQQQIHLTAAATAQTIENSITANFGAPYVSDATPTNTRVTFESCIVTDGDTVIVGSTRIRLVDIDAPELKQDGGVAAKLWLERMVKAEIWPETFTHQKRLSLHVMGVDKYNRTLGRIILDWPNTASTPKDLSIEMVRYGQARIYEKYAPKDPLRNLQLHQLQTIAREAKIGLWSNPQSIPPWIWRKSSSSNRGSSKQM